MLITLLIKEILENVRNGRLLFAFLLCSIIIPTGFYSNYTKYRMKYTHYQEAVRLYENSHKTVQDVMQRGAEVFRLPSPLSIVSAGIEQLYPTSVESVGFFRHNGANTQFINTRSLDNPYVILYGSLDLSVIVVIFMSVLATLFSFNSVSGEKESGSLALILSNSVPRHKIVLSKTAANCILLLVVYTSGIVIGVILLRAMGCTILNEGVFALHFALAVVISYIYITTFVLLGMMVSSLSKSSILSIVILLFLWVFFAMIFPKLSAITAKLIRPVKSQQVINLEKNQRRIQHNSEIDEEIDALLASSDELSNMSISEFRKDLRAEGERSISYVEQQREIQEYHKAVLQEELQRIETHYANQKRAQIALARNIARVSPVSCFIHLMAELSHTGLLEYRQWQLTHLDFRRTLDEQLCSYYESSVRFKNFSSGNFTGNREAAAPRFIDHSVSLNDIFNEVWIDLVILILYALFFFISAHVLFLKYDVR